MHDEQNASIIAFIFYTATTNGKLKKTLACVKRTVGYPDNLDSRTKTYHDQHRRQRADKTSSPKCDVQFTPQC